MKKAMLLKTVFTFFIFIICSATGRAQDTLTVQGKVVDEQNEPIIGAIVEPVLKTGNISGTQTDVDGNFILKLPTAFFTEQGKTEVRIRASYPGYEAAILPWNFADPVIFRMVKHKPIGHLKPIPDGCTRTNMINPENPTRKTFSGSDIHNMGY